MSKDKKTEPTEEITEDQLVRRPANLINAQVSFRPLDPAAIKIGYRFVDSRPDSFYDPSLGPFGALGSTSIGAYHLFDVYLTCQPGKLLDVGLRVENLFDVDYREIQGFNTRGRGVYLKVGFRLSGK